MTIGGISKDELQKLTSENNQLEKQAKLLKEIEEKKKALGLPTEEVKNLEVETKKEIAVKQPGIINLAQNFLDIPTLVDLNTVEFERCLIYGDPGMGKTLQMALLSEFYNILFIDGDKGTKTITMALPIEMQKRIHTLKIPNTSANPQFHNTLLKLVTGSKCNICLKHGTVDCSVCQMSKEKSFSVELNKLPADWIVCVDSVTEFVSSAVFAINKRVTKKPDTVDDFKFTFDEWGELKQIMEKFGTYIKDLQCHSFWASHATLVDTADESVASAANQAAKFKNQKLVPIGGSDPSSRNFSKYFSTAVHAKIFNNKHIYVTSPTYNAYITAKSRSNVALEKEPIPALLHILRKDAKELLAGSWTEWFFSDRKKPEPKVKDVLSIN